MQLKSPRGTRSRLRPMERCFNRTFSSLRPQPHSRSPRPLPAAPLGVRGPAEQAESIETERFDEATALLLSAREAGPRTGLPLTRHRSEGMGEACYSFRMKVPLFPPPFLTRRISPIDISRSTALHMS